ncbi:MAG: ATP-dependent DNA helicase RecG [Acidobacteria bacterium]|nr:ATP-dependent DNA helicase RecG [Acidobacteriota bacterium]
MMDLDTSIAYLKGVGPNRAKVFESKGLFTVEDLLYTMPFRYEDRSNLKPISQLAPGETATLVGEVRSAGSFGSRSSRARIFEVRVRDASGATMAAKWFRGDYLQRIFEPGQVVALYGKIEWNRYENGVEILHPEYEILSADDEQAALHLGRITPIYRAVGKINTRALRGLIGRALETAAFPEDPLPEAIRRRMALPERARALWDAHFPPEGTDLRLLAACRTPAQFRLIMEEFFFLECGLALKRRKARAAPGIAFELNDRARDRIKRILPFKPTNAQKRALGEIAQDMAKPTPMNRLLQGDVGSGKTIVAVQAAVIALESGYQVALMAPTEILAQQHYYNLRKLLEPAGYVVAGLTGSFAKSAKTKLKRLIASGLAHVVVGTHALISKDVDFHKLGLIVIDEQHRFGVLQRLELLRKGLHPDVLVMTATPIPRTLSLTLYGELDVSVIDELPPGRTPIVTRARDYDHVERVYSFVAQQVGEGRQAYVVCPLVEESESKTAKAATETWRQLSEEVFPELKVGLLHGRMTPSDKEAAMESFQSGETQVLVSTTVVEVGVDVPNASVMVIEHAENFGLAQLHQLRGRVGRGAAQSYCILLTGGAGEAARERIAAMERTQDGFEIADIDLQLRGPGEFFGVKQSGLPEFRVANLVRDREALEIARNEATAFVETPPSREELEKLVSYIRDRWQRRYGLVQVG